MEEQEGLAHGAFRVEIHMAVLGFCPTLGAAAVDYQQTVHANTNRDVQKMMISVYKHSDATSR